MVRRRTMEELRQDYRHLLWWEGKRHVAFAPRHEVGGPDDLAAELQDYAQKNKLELVMLEPGMKPVFLLDGIQYTGDHVYHSCGPFTAPRVHCTAAHPERFAPKVTAGERILMLAFHFGWPLVLLFFLMAFAAFTGPGAGPGR